MRKFYTLFFKLLPLALAVGSSYAARAQVTYSQVPLTAASFTADVIANGTAAVAPAAVPTTGTNQDVDGSGYYFISQDYNTATASHTSGIPNSGAIPNAIAGYSALTYQLAPFTGNNSLRIPATGTTATTGSGTATFATPTAAAEVYVLVTGGSAGSAGITVNMTVTYADNTTTAFTAQSVPDWYTANTTFNVFGMTARANSTAAVNPATANSPGTAPFFDQVKLTIPANKVQSAIKSITFDKTSTGGFLHVFAVSIGTYPVCTVAPTTQAQATTTSGGSTALTTACSSTSIYLSLSNLPANSGYSYQWQSSPNNSTWTSISGATSSTYTATGQTAATYYRCLVYCAYDSGSGATPTPSGSVQVAQSAFDACYCTPSSSSGCGTYGIITSVAITGTSLSNSPGCISSGSAGYSSAYYANYAAAGSPTATLAPGTTYTITGMVGRSTRAYLWIDYDHSGTFDSGEATQIAYNTTTSAAAYSTTFTVPAGALAGNTRMRIRSDYYTYTTITAATSTAACNSTTYGESLDYLVTIAPSTACSGVPPATTLASSSGSSVCSNAAFTLTASGPAAGTTGLSYQFQSSPAGAGTFSNLGSAQTAATYTVSSQTAATDYRVVVTCTNSNLSRVSNAVSLAQNAFTACYCQPSSSSAGEYLTNVTLGSLNNSTGNSVSGTPSGYTDYSASPTATQTTSLTCGATYPVSITAVDNRINSTGMLWIDYDHSGTFDATNSAGVTEYLLIGSGPSSGTFPQTLSFTNSLTIPTSALSGPTHLRVRWHNDASTAGDACTLGWNGETEEYLVTLVAPTACSGTPAVATASASASAVCQGVAFTLSATNPGNIGGLTYQWQSSPAGAGTFAAISGATSQTYSVSSQAAATDYRVVVTCTSSNLSSVSNVVSVGQNSFLTCYCTPVTSGTSSDGITKVVLTTPAGTLTNSSSATNTSPYYTDYSATQTAGTLPIPTLYVSGTATLAVTMGSDPNQYSGAWIDFDHSGTFDTGEYFTAGTNAGSSGTSTFTISVPAGALAGQTKLRVRGGDDLVLLNTQSCTAAGSTSNYGEVEDYLVAIAPAVPCTGTPATTTAAASVSAICAGVPFNLSATGIVAGTTGLTYQWQSRTGTAAFADLSGATTNPYTVSSQTTATDYRLVVTCTASGQSSTSNAVSVAQNAAADCYCTPTGGVCTNEYIRGVVLNTLSNVGTGTTGTGCSGTGGYNDYTTNSSLTTTLTQGSTYTVTLNLRINSNPAAAGLWIDYDHSGTFDASEFTQVFSNTTLSGSNDVTGTVSLTIPAAALTGTTRLRVRSANSSVPLSASGACQNTFYGEVEDYLITIAPPPCAGTPPTATASASVGTACVNAPFTLSATGIVAGTPGLTYQWQSSPAGAGTFSNLSGATTNPYPVGSQTNATDYRLVVTCTASGQSSTSNAVSVGQSSFLSCYVTPVTSDASANYISSVSVNGASGFTNTTNGAPANGYNDFTANSALTTTLTKGNSYPLTITVQSNSANSQGGLWIDFDHSATFDAGEYFQFGSSSATGTAVTFNYMLAIPSTSAVLTGPTRLRLRWRDGTIAPTDGQTQVVASGGLLQKPTANWNGETEDYLITLAAAPLPVQLLSFTATAQGSAVRLAWATASELHSDRFEVERSLDGAAFGRIGTVAAAGNSATTRGYAFLDESTPTGIETLYYRLRQVDVGGPATYSPVRAVPVGSAGLAVFPNPAHSVATLTGAGAGASVQVLDVLSRVVLSTQADAAGRATLPLPAGLADGLYLVRTGDRTVRLVLTH